MAIIGETPNEKQEREATRDEVWQRSMNNREWLDQFVAIPPVRNVLSRLPRCLMGYLPRSLPKSDELIDDKKIKTLLRECNDIQIATRRKMWKELEGGT